MKLANFQGEPEVFYSIQGEGRNAGRASVFVRTSLCNLHCYWCDTDYTWNWVGSKFPHLKDGQPGYAKFDPKREILDLTVPELVPFILRHPCAHVVLTGGEPLLQQDDLAELMAVLRARDAGFTFEVETNGTLLPDERFDRAIDQYTVSPKLTNSRNAPEKRLVPVALSFFSTSAKANFKFVISRPEDLGEVLEIQRRHAIPAARIYLMAEALDEAALQARARPVIDLALAHGFNYSDRLHIRLFGNKRAT
jgi:7-carboxy-7-deazaguanine synthase